MTLPSSSSVPIVPSDFGPFSRWISAAFRLFGEQWQTWVLQGLIVFACTALPVSIVYIIMFFAMFFTASSHSSSSPPTMIFGFMAFYFVLIFLMLFLMVYFFAGMTRTALKQMRGEPITVSDLFTGGASYGPLLGTTIIVGFLTMLGAIFCYIPAFLVGGMYLTSTPLVVDRRMGVTEALSTAWAIGRQNILLFTVYYFILTLILGVFFIVTMPIYILGVTVAYYDLTYGLGDGHAMPGVPLMPPTPPYQPPPDVS